MSDEQHPIHYELEIKGLHLDIETAPGLFSPSAPDRGTLAMISTVEILAGQRVLDLGCGCGIVGIWASLSGASVVLTDMDARALDCARHNAQVNGADSCMFHESDGFRQLDETGFDWILSNPPYHTDYAVARHFIEKGFNRLTIGGRLVLVVKRADWYRNKLKAIFGGCKDLQIDGYHVLTAEKRDGSYGNRQSKAPKTASSSLKNNKKS